MQPLEDKGGLEHLVAARLPTEFGEFDIHLYSSSIDRKEHIALVMGDLSTSEPVLARVHSECLTGEIFGSRRCDCGPQLALSLELIAQAGRGVLLYMRQEGRGIGLADNLRAYNLQDEGMDTVDANLALGHQADARHYDSAALMLRDLGVNRVALLTNNPSKIEELQKLGVEVAERIPLVADVTPENERYLLTKAARMRHLLDIDAPKSQNGAA
jgi:GTP cyclohydrolase II